MEINKIRIKNFRNIENLNIFPDKKINFILGENGQGKTNLIESIYFCSFLKSYRTQNILNLIKSEKDFSLLDLDINNENVENSIKVNIDKNKKKKILLNNKKPESKNYYDVIKSIIYYPSEINYLLIYPQFRRDFIDKSIFITDVGYLDIYKKYRKILKQRNSLLKLDKYSREEDLAWIERLVFFGKKIIERRKSFIKRINYYLSDNRFFENETYKIIYNNYNFDNLEDDLNNKFKDSYDKEIKYKHTLVGPHTDDFIFNLNNHDIRKFSSEGQKKSFILNLKKSQIEDYFNLYNSYPVLILDDISNELDNRRREKLFNKIIENSGQVFITMADISYNIPNGYSKFFIKNGEITN